MAPNEKRISLAKKTPYFEIFPAHRNLMRWRAAVVLASATMFITCLIQTAFVTECCFVEGDTERIGGLVILLIGWGGVLGSWLHPLLFVLIIAGWVCACAKWRVAALICASCSIGVVAIFHEQVFPNAGYVAWLANPIIVAAWFFYLSDKRSAALISAFLALGLTLMFLWVAEVPLSNKLGDVKIVSYGTGYWLWIASAGILVAGMTVRLLLFRYLASGIR
jgi:hypothetical protein